MAIIPQSRKNSRGQGGPFCTREATSGKSRGQEGPICTRGLPTDQSRGQEGPFCTREAAASRFRGQGRLFCTRGDGGMRQRAGVSTPGHGQGEGPDGYKFARSADAVDVGRGRSERSEWSPARCWQPAGKTSVTRSRGQGRAFCTREHQTSRPRGQRGPFCTREAAAISSRGQRRPICTREAAAGWSRGQGGPFCTRDFGKNIIFARWITRLSISTSPFSSWWV